MLVSSGSDKCGQLGREKQYQRPKSVSMGINNPVSVHPGIEGSVES